MTVFFSAVYFHDFAPSIEVSTAGLYLRMDKHSGSLLPFQVLLKNKPVGLAIVGHLENIFQCLIANLKPT
eukprot:c25762_g15_i1 orf=226-435(+)